MLNGNVCVAVIGYGGMGKHHTQRVAKVEGLALKGVYDIKPERNEVARHDGLYAYPSYEAVLDDKDVDLVIVAVPNDRHITVCEQAMNSGKHVVCEKPVSLTSAEFLDMVDCSEKNNVVFTVNQNRRWDRDYLTAKKIYDEKTLGPVFNVESRVHGSRGIPGDWRNKKRYGGGMVLDWGVHLIDQVMQMINLPIETVQAQFFYVSNEECEDGFKLLIEYKGGMKSHVEVGTSNFINLPRWYILGENGSAVVDDWQLNGKIVMVSDWENRDAVPVVTEAGLTKTMAPRTSDTIKEYPLPPVQSDVLDFYRNVRDAASGKAEPLIKHDEVLRCMVLMEAMFDAVERRCVITDFEERYAAALKKLKK